MKNTSIILSMLILSAPAISSAKAAGRSEKILGPPWFQECLVYYNAFEGKLEEAEVNSDKVEIVNHGAVETMAEGLFGRACHVKDWRAPFVLKNPAFSPHQPWTLSFWWALPYDLALDGGYSLFSLNGHGMIALFCRGKGEWCALQRPAGVFQVYYFDGIQNVNGIYDGDLLAHYDLHAGVWHHSAVIFRRATTCEVYTDGKKVFEVTVNGRAFSEKDALFNLSLGGPLYLDDLAILDRAVESEMIADYFRGVTQVRGYLTPSLK